ncbi:transporter substrate-binding domain-containing protein [Acidovorax sp.]|uniref:substrate-binding periplasmic protein n=1 Tax=Acidovorax sp. TaxID=1872122 RepID=UPI002ACE1FC2|nr:transporter substrate-binding domain-containing protein [Acidovorax sp.]MDZ7862238.1 transporter substrate-binding domain-containing protein [Acidovorax sp.]
MTLIRTAALAVAVLCVGLRTAAAAPPLVFAIPPEDRLSVTMAQRVLTTAYQALGQEILFTKLPPRRGVQLANEADGVGVAVTPELAPTLTRIDVPIAYEEAAVYATRRDIVPNGYASLQPYLIGHIAGIGYLEAKFKGMRTETASTVETLFRKLEQGRTDVAVDSRFNSCVIKQQGLHNVVLLQPSLESAPGFHFLHQRHADLIPRITATLQRMAADGSIKKIQAQALKEYRALCD